MNDERDFEQRVTSMFDGSAPSRGPDDLLEDVFAVTGQTRPRPRWWTSISERPMRYDSALVSGSPSIRTTSLLAATMLLLVALVAATVAGAQLLGGGETYVVAPDGSADFNTIAEALAVAADGDTVLVRPGTYREDLYISADITIRGEGPREAVVLAPTGAGPRAIVDRGTPAETGLPVGIDLQMSDARIEGLTIEGTVPLVGIRVNGGAPEFTDLAVSIPDVNDDAVEVAVLLAGGSSTVLQEVTLDQRLQLREASSMTLAGGAMERAVELVGPGRAEISGSRFGHGSWLFASDGARGQVRNSDFEGSPITVETASDFEITGNTFEEVSGTAVTVSHAGTVARIHGNDIRDSDTGVAIGPNTKVALTDNTICGNETNVFESSSATTDIRDNVVSGTCPD